MTVSTQRVTLDISKNMMPPLVRLGQGDKSGTRLVATILDDGGPFSLTGYSVRFAMRLPHDCAHYSVNGTASGNVATFNIDEAYAASVAGKTSVAYVEILQGNTVICSTSRMNVIVLESAYEGVDPAHVWDNGVEEFLDNAQAELDNAVADAGSAISAANAAATAANTAANDANDAAQAATDAAAIIFDKPDALLESTVESTTPQAVTDAWPTTPKSSKLYGKSVQSGTPTPSNPVDVQVVGAPNMLPYPYASIDSGKGITFTDNGDGSITANGTATANTYVYLTNNSSAFQLPAGQYCASLQDANGNPLSQGVRVLGGHWVNGSYTQYFPGTYGAASFTHDGTGNVQIVTEVINGTTVNNLTFYPQLEKGTTATHYVKHGCIGLQIGSTIVPIDMQGNTLASLPDGTRDVLRVDSAGHVTIEKHTHIWNMRNYSSSSWTKSSSAINGYYINCSTLNPKAETGAMGNCACNMATPRSGTTDYFAIINSCLVDSNFNFNLDATTVGSTLANFKTWLASNDLYMLAKLATPATIDLGTITLPELVNPCELAFYASLDPTWAITYERDPNIVIGRIESSIAPVEGKTASANYAVGSYLVHGDRLYKVTTAIATGEAINPGTNCTATTVMAELAALTA